MADLVNDFLTEEEFSLRNSLAYAGLGLSKVTGQVTEIVSGVGFAGQQYSAERQKRMADILGEMLFHWHVLATTVDGVGVEQIIEQYIAHYEAVREHLKQQRITIHDMMEMKKHVKPGALREIERNRDNAEKKKIREKFR